MVDQLLITQDDFYIPDADQLITENDAPVDNFASEKQQRLLISSLYTSLEDQTFLAAANVGIYYSDLQPAIVPDVFISLDVHEPENWWEKQNRCYMTWRFGKPPELALEIVSNKVGGEIDEKLSIYEKMRVSYYVVYDPTQQLGNNRLRIYELRGRRYTETQTQWLDQIDLGITLWQGSFEGRTDEWLRWCNRSGLILLTGDELAEQERQRAKQERQRAEQAEQRAQQLAERLRSLGIDPDTV